MGARSKSRKRALDVLFAADARGVDPLAVAGERAELADRTGTNRLDDYAQSLVAAVAAHRRRLDELIAQHSVGWTLERMPAVDRSILRLAVAELLYSDDVPAAVAVDEAVELAKTLSTDDSPRFVNGVLGQIAAVAAALHPGGRAD